MSKLYICGKNKLGGELTVQGAKNGALPILAAAVLCEGTSVIKNCPRLSDTNASIRILEHLGCKCAFENNTLTVDANNVSNCEIPDELMQEMRSSIVLLGAVAARVGCVRLGSPGGCELGPRPIDIHISALRQMGLTIEEDHGYLTCHTENGLHGETIHLVFPSVGATENIMLAAVTAKGRTVIKNAAKEPEIVDLAAFLSSAGGKILGAGSDTIIIDGVEKLSSCEHTVLPDRIVAATYMTAVAVTGGELTLKNVQPHHMSSILWHMREIGCKVYTDSNKLSMISNGKLNGFRKISTMVYPGFPTDAGPLFVAAATVAKGTSMFVENIFENRYNYIGELLRLGADIKIANKVAVINGVNSLSSAYLKSTDLRGGAAMVIAALAAEGESVVDNVSYIDRGYEDIEINLQKLGADIKRKD